ncbi:hypothetical protein ACFE04_021061 [Oxalis oulophora]
MTKLHELLLDLLRQHSFKYEFSKEFITYYPSVVNVIIEEVDDGLFRKYPLLSKFSVQIFPTLTLTARLVEEHNLLVNLCACLEQIFVASAGEGGRLELMKLRKFYLITIHVVEDIEHVIRHATVAKFMVRDLLRTWFRILSFVQGINPEKRETTFHVGCNDFEADLPFVVARSIGNINSLLVNGAFDLFKQDIDDNIQVPESAIRLTYECLRAIMSWI